MTAIGLRREDYGTHSLRRTKASIIYKATGNLRAVQLLLGHTKIESTVRYLGVDVEDALTLAEHLARPIGRNQNLARRPALLLISWSVTSSSRSAGGERRAAVCSEACRACHRDAVRV